MPRSGPRRLDLTLVPRRLDRTLVTVAAALALTACGTAPAETPPSGGEMGAPEPAYSCFGPPYPASAWAGGQSAGDADHPGLEVLLAEMRTDDLDGWFVLEASDERLTVTRELPEDYPADEMLRTHEVVSIMYAENLESGPWVLGQWSACAPQLAMDDLGPADVWLDGTPDPAASEVSLLVKEIGCASGQSADGRVQVVSLEVEADAVTFVIGVAPIPGEVTCPDNPASPVTLELSGPLAGRTLVDASVYPPQEVSASPPGLYR